MREADSVGARIAQHRKIKGWTAKELAERAGVGHDPLRKVEAGRTSPSTFWVGRVAEALGVDMSRLYAEDSEDTQTLDIVPVIRRTLAAVDLMDEDLEPLAVAELAPRVAEIGNWRRGARYRRIGEALPGLVDQLLVSADEYGEPVYGLLTDAYRAANTLAHKYGHPDLSMTAVERMLWSAGKSSDPLRIASVEYLKAATLARIGAQRQAMKLLDRAVSDIEPLARAGQDRAALAVLSTLHMRAGTISATIGQGDISRAHLDEAERLVAGIPDGITVLDTVVGSTNVALHRIAAEVDLGEAGRALDIARKVRMPKGFASERKTYYWVDTARAHLLAGDPDAAIEALMESREAAPEHFRASGTVKAAVRATADQQRRTTSSLRSLANAAGIAD
ncbi:helix-turn-helix domain-containing protein [Nocardia cyriacigeorgica]|uniref:helix-turn-helix domain-containing protein n=1 Tax=Nocardia cyriacigeorgica TaxID=135487 RepID=UPI0013B8A291|nr:helix-turn-helix domain-containing protein [Nocardia cyriacigeorgica]NEW49314.1 helix-turn-helix domain-containing protein [Nocardia cyriacigeorgica]